MATYSPIDELPKVGTHWYILWGAAGLLEGFASVKALVPFSKVLADQFIFRNFIVLKMFLGAVGGGMLTQSVMAYYAPERFEKSRTYAQFRYGYGRVALGNGILGVGMAVAGSGPTMIGPAIGADVSTAWGLVVGGLGAAVVIGLIDKVAPFSPQPKDDERPMTAEKLVGGSYTIVAAGMGTIMVGAAIALEIFVNFKDDASKYGGPLAQPYPLSIWSYPAWPPTLAGLAIGIGLIPVRMAQGEGMGGATSFFSAVGTLTNGWLNPGNSLFQNVSQLWQIAYNYVFCLMGAALARGLNPAWALDETTQPLTDGFALWRMAVGAFLAIVGGRFAGGCTCGHGVSGTSELSTESFVGAACIFGGAIAARCVMVFAFNIEY